MRELRKPNIDMMENMECYSYYYEAAYYRFQMEQMAKEEEYARQRQQDGDLRTGLGAQKY